MELQNDHNNSSNASNTGISTASSSSSAINTVVNISRYFKFPPGYRFRPTDRELVMDYLGRKIRNEPLPPNHMLVSDIYSNNPMYFAETYKDLREEEWYLLTPRTRKYPKGKRPNRSTGDGYWKATGADKPIKHEENIIGFKKTLVFYLGQSPNGEKTNWVMHEYRVNEPPRTKKHEKDMKLDDWVLCRIYEKFEHPPKKTNCQSNQVNQARSDENSNNGNEHLRIQFESNDSIHDPDPIAQVENITYDSSQTFQETPQEHDIELPNTDEESNEIYNNFMGDHQHSNLAPLMAPQSVYSPLQNNTMPIEPNHHSNNYLEDVVQS